MADKQWELVQKKAFTHWVNSYLEKKGFHIDDLEDGFKTGVLLARLLEILTGEDMPGRVHQNPRLRVHSLENCNLALNFLKKKQVRDVTIGAEEIVDGNLKMLLGFCWVLLRQFRGGAVGGNDSSFEEGLLAWVREELSDYDDIEINNFKTSFNDGRAFLALLNKLKPDVINYYDRDLSNAFNNADFALKVAEDDLRIPPLLNASALSKGEEKDKSIVLYLSLLENAFKNEREKRNLAGQGEAKVTNLREKLKQLEEENARLRKRVSELEGQLEEQTVSLKHSKEDAASRLQNEKEELRQAKERLQKEKQELLSEKEDLLEQLRKQRAARERLEESIARDQKRNGVSLETLRKNLVQHLTDMHTWKDFLEQNKEYEADKIQVIKEKEIVNKSLDDQLESLADALSEENSRLEQLLKEKEERSKGDDRKKTQKKKK